jgi:hypothetical protein
MQQTEALMDQFLRELKSEYILTRKRKPPERTGKVTIIESETQIRGIKGQEKWRVCPFGEMEIGDAFLIAGKRTMVNSRLFLWALHFDKKREKKFHVSEENGMVTCIRTE